MKKRHLDREDRKQRRHWRLQDRSPSCRICGYDRPMALERHHIAGRKHHDDTVIVCRNCHSELSDLQLDHRPAAEPKPPIEPERVGMYLLGLCDFHSLAIERMREFAVALIEESTHKGDAE